MLKVDKWFVTLTIIEKEPIEKPTAGANEKPPDKNIRMDKGSQRLSNGV